MKILVLGCYYSQNLGDGVICECVAKRLSQHFPDAEIELYDVLDRDTFTGPLKTDMQILRRRQSRERLREIATRYLHWDKQLKHEEYRLSEHLEHIQHVASLPCDLAVFAGGQLFMDSYSLILSKYVACFSRRGIPVFFNACGTGPTYSREVRSHLSDALTQSEVALCSCRDDIGMLNQVYMHSGRHAVATYDPALWSSEVYGISAKQNRDTIGLGVMYTYSINPDLVARFWVRLIREMERRKMNWKIFVNGSGSDIVFARHVHALVPELGRTFEECFIPAPCRPEELVEMISCFQSIISFRLHSHIIAASLNIPSVAMVWDNKLKFFFEKLGHGERCCTVRESPDAVLAKLERAEQEEYDRRLIEDQKHFADRLLYEAIAKKFQA